ncbi:LysM domain-containing protein [Naegleria gruberi]|uniref:LysM domain-containing protein n=1 Tax=Naegleria gruberi TaxID=5762 RepID=D2VLY2_NAEGR|nr:LysM domain-containing protein [Naegleria gruberi]EFC42224.1 LysM domain-containing protein [Naegleria gruberi]|eukprot:XP_002674968.1 LysM domain-containing protein [Naegleria gruberi strain NEG-M]
MVKVQTTNVDQHGSKPASAPPLAEHNNYQTDSMYPTIPEYLISSSSSIQPQYIQQPIINLTNGPRQQSNITPIYIMPQHTNVMYPVSAHGNVMYVTPQQQQMYYYQNQTTAQQQIPQQPQQQNAQTTVEEEKPYFVHQLNRHTDTLMKLALRYHCHEEDIKMLNTLLCDDLDLYEGTTLLIPKCDPSLIKKNYDLEETRIQTERQRQLMVTTFSKNHNITIDEAKVYLEMNDWNSRKAQEELLQDQAWEKQTTGTVKKPSDFNQPKTKTYSAPQTRQGNISHRSVGKDAKFPQYGYEMMTYER